MLLKFVELVRLSPRNKLMTVLKTEAEKPNTMTKQSPHYFTKYHQAMDLLNAVSTYT